MSTDNFFNEETSNAVWFGTAKVYPFGKVVCENHYILVP
jgi:hypothetical protein